MAKPLQGRHSAEIDGDFVVFLIGARPSLRHPIRSIVDLGGRRGMRHMLTWLTEHPEKGLLGFEMGLPTIVQYWRSFEHLEAYARDHNRLHWPAWVDFNKKIGKSRGDVGIWHETYLIKPGQYEAVYSGMPPYGLGKAGKLVPASGLRDAAAGRVRATVSVDSAG